MKWEGPLSKEQVMAVLENAPVAIYVSALDTWELLYANQTAQRLIAHRTVRTCYQAVGFDSPCPFCQVRQMNYDDLAVREFEHPGNHRIYQLSGKLIDWDGVPAHIEYILDITERKREQTREKEAMDSLQEMFSSVPCGLCVYRAAKGKITPLIHNPAFYKIMGYSQEHIQAVQHETAFLGVHPDDLAALQAKIQAMVKQDATMHHTYRVWNDTKQAYRWIHLAGSVNPQDDGTKLLFGVYTDVSGRMQLQEELTDANEKMQDIVNAIPGGVAIYKVSDIFETVYFSDGVPALTGYSVEEYKEQCKGDAAALTYWEDTEAVVAKAREVIRTHEAAKIEFRKLHRNGHIVWVRAQITWIGTEDGCPLLHCVFHNITDLKQAQLEMDHLINSIPGGIASYRVEGQRFIPTFYSDGVPALSGHSRAEFDTLIERDALNVIYAPDRERVLAAAIAAMRKGEVLDVSYRMRHKDGNLIWIHLNGRRMGPLTESMQFYAVFTGMSSETRLFQNIANETADGIYVIDKHNYDLLYVNESKHLFTQGKSCLGQKCYKALHGKDAPCEFCTLGTYPPDGQEHEMPVKGTDRFYNTRFKETDWNGIPSYIKYVRDVTDEVLTRREKERLEMYFQTVVKNLPGGISVARYDDGGVMEPEFISDGLAALCRLPLDEMQKRYGKDLLDLVHPDDVESVRSTLQRSMAKGDTHCELTGRIHRGDGSYLWVKSTLSVLESNDGVRRLYAVYTDITKTVEEKKDIRKQYNNLILQHYRTQDPNVLVVGHCNITQNRIMEIIDYTDSALLETFGSVREAFFTGLSSLVVEPEERQRFLDRYLNGPALKAFQANEREQVLECFIKLPKEKRGRYAQIKMNLVATPDSGDVTGILTVTDITEQVIAERILHQLSMANYDFVIDLNLEQDAFTVLTGNKDTFDMPEKNGCHSERMAHMLRTAIVPKDKERYQKALAREEILKRLQTQSSYTFSFSMLDEKGDIHTKNMTVSAVDLRLGRVCLMRTDITESLREQQGLLNMIAYTFELAATLDVRSDRLTMHTRQTVLENLAPYNIEHYSKAVECFFQKFGVDEDGEKACDALRPDEMRRRLEEKPGGYDFVFPYQDDDGLHYKQVVVLWGDENHRTICMVRADVTDMLTAERKTKKALEKALLQAEDANKAKSDFLSAMSHDIRTPMNAIMGMTALAIAHLDDQARVSDCLNKISISSKHLLSLINDILDMSKIERSKVPLNHMRISLADLVEQVSAIMGPQARAAGLQFEIQAENIEHCWFYGDSLRINQILLNLLSNAVKFTPAGGQIGFTVEEIAPLQNEKHARYRFTVSDTGMGMSEEFLAHLFEPFTRSHSAERIEGTGLGLSVTKGLIDLMGGVIHVQSREGQGSVFTVELECERAEADTMPQQGTGALQTSAPTDRPLAGRRFLLAEDNAINAEILSELLLMEGAQSRIVTNGAAAVQAFADAAPGTFDAVLMDIQMPVMNGYEATRALRELGREDAKSIPIVAMTANAFAEDVQASLDAGMSAHVAKPIDVAVLKDTLFKVLKG